MSKTLVHLKAIKPHDKPLPIKDLPVYGPIIRDGRMVGSAGGIISIKEIKPRGARPKREKWMAVALAREVLISAGKGKHEAAEYLVGEGWYTEATKVREAVRKAKTLFKGGKFVLFVADDFMENSDGGSKFQTAAFLMDSSARIELEGDNKIIDGLGWYWEPWQKEASYSHYQVSIE